MVEKKIEAIFEKRQWYLKWMCENWSDLYESWFGSCLKKLAYDFWLDPNNFWTPNEEEDDW